MIRNHWDTENAILRGKFIAIQAYLIKQEKSQIKKQSPQSVEKRK